MVRSRQPGNANSSDQLDSCFSSPATDHQSCGDDGWMALIQLHQMT
jgi:hypothetical protein